MYRKFRIFVALIMVVIMTAGLAGCGRKAKEKEKDIPSELDKAEIEVSDQGDPETEASIDVTEESSSTEDTHSSSSGEKPLELTDYGWYVGKPSEVDDNLYINFCGIIYNPNENLIAEFPKVLVTVRSEDGSILGTEGQTGSAILPGDTVTLCGMLSVPASEYNENAQFEFDTECSDFTKDSSMYENVKTSDLVISNVSEKRGDLENTVTGEVTNNSQSDLDMVNLSVVLRKDGKIVFMENTFVDGLNAGKTKAFELNSYDEWPEYDAIECSAQQW